MITIKTSNNAINVNNLSDKSITITAKTQKIFHKPTSIEILKNIFL